MEYGLKAAITGMKMSEQGLELVAHNLSNVNTYGYKEKRMTFESTLQKAFGKKDGVSEPKPDVKINFSQGALVNTDNPLHFTILGEGFFEVQQNGETFYTRNGAFSLNSAGNLVTSNGAVVASDQGNIEIAGTGNVQVSSEGLIVVDGEEAGNLKVVSFEDPSKLESAGSTLFRAGSEATTKSAEGYSIAQGGVESSNSQTVSGLMNLIQISRQFQTYQKVVQVQRRLDQESILSMGRLS